MRVVDFAINRHSSSLYPITPNNQRYFAAWLILWPVEVEKAAMVRSHYD